MRERGYALGGSLDNAIVVSGNKILNQVEKYSHQTIRHILYNYFLRNKTF